MLESDDTQLNYLAPLKSIFYEKDHPMENAIEVVSYFMQNKIWDPQTRTTIDIQLYTNNLLKDFLATLPKNWQEKYISEYTDVGENVQNIDNLLRQAGPTAKKDEIRKAYYLKRFESLKNDYDIFHYQTRESGSSPIGRFCQECIKHFETKCQKHYERYNALAPNLLLTLLLKNFICGLDSNAKTKNIIASLLDNKTASPETMTPEKDKRNSVSALTAPGTSVVVVDNHGLNPPPSPTKTGSYIASALPSATVTTPRKGSYNTTTPAPLLRIASNSSLASPANKSAHKSPSSATSLARSTSSTQINYSMTPRADDILSGKKDFSGTPRESPTGSRVIFTPKLTAEQMETLRFNLHFMRDANFFISSESPTLPETGGININSDKTSAGLFSRLMQLSSSSDEAVVDIPDNPGLNNINDDLPDTFWNLQERFSLILDRLIAVFNQKQSDPAVISDKIKKDFITNLLVSLKKLKAWIADKSRHFYLVLSFLDPENKVVRVSPELRLQSTTPKPATPLLAAVANNSGTSISATAIPDRRTNNSKSPREAAENSAVGDSHTNGRRTQSTDHSSPATPELPIKKTDSKKLTHSKNDDDSINNSLNPANVLAATPGSEIATPVPTRKNGSKIMTDSADLPPTDSDSKPKKKSGSHIGGALATKSTDNKAAPATTSKPAPQSQPDVRQVAPAIDRRKTDDGFSFGKFLGGLFSVKSDNKNAQKPADQTHARKSSVSNLTASSDGQQKTVDKKTGRTSSSGSIDELNKKRTASTGSLNELQQARVPEAIFTMDDDASKSNPNNRPP